MISLQLALDKTFASFPKIINLKQSNKKGDLRMFGNYSHPWITILGHTFTKADALVAGIIFAFVVYQVSKDIAWDKRIHKYDKTEKKDA